MFGGVVNYLYLCGAVCGTFAAIDGCDETREQPRMAADETQRGRPGMAADDNILMMTPAGWEGISWAAGGFFADRGGGGGVFAAKLGCKTGIGMKKKEGECLVVL